MHFSSLYLSTRFFFFLIPLFSPIDLHSYVKEHRNLIPTIKWLTRWGNIYLIYLSIYDLLSLIFPLGNAHYSYELLCFFNFWHCCQAHNFIYFFCKKTNKPYIKCTRYICLKHSFISVFLSSTAAAMMVQLYLDLPFRSNEQHVWAHDQWTGTLGYAYIYIRTKSQNGSLCNVETWSSVTTVNGTNGFRDEIILYECLHIWQRIIILSWRENHNLVL